MRSFSPKGNSLVEYCILLVIIVAALLTMQVYMKRGIQGRWKASVDDMGEQYDVGKTTGNVEYTLQSRSRTNMYLVTGIDANYTMRQDWENSQETKNSTLETIN